MFNDHPTPNPIMSFQTIEGDTYSFDTKGWVRVETKLYFITYPDDDHYQIHLKPTHPDYDADNPVANVTQYVKSSTEQNDAD